MKKLIVLACLLVPVGVVAVDDDPTLGDKPLSVLLKQLQSENRGLQVRAARVLSDAPAELRPTIAPKVTPLLKSERENDRFVAAQFLGECGPVARSAVPDLLPMLKGTQYERNRAAAAKALGQILKDAKTDPEIDAATAALVLAFKDSYEDVRREAAVACGMIGPSAKACIPSLPPLLKEPHTSTVALATAWTCERMGLLAKEHVDLLISLMHGYYNGGSTPAFALALGAIGPVQENIVANLTDAMEEGGVCPRTFGILTALEAYGPKAAPAVSLLDKFLRERRFTVPKCTPGKGGMPCGGSLPDVKAMTQIVRILKNVGPAARTAEKTLRDIQASGMVVRPELDKEENLAAWTELQRAVTEALAAIAGEKGK